MLRLEIAPAPRWIDLLPGVRLRVAPMTSAVWLAARAECADVLDETASGGAEWSVGVVKAVAGRLILGWEGIGDADGGPIEPSAPAISALLDRRDAWEAFEARVFAPWYLLSAEKNVFAPSPGSTSPGATIAVDATGSALPAPAENTRR